MPTPTRKIEHLLQTDLYSRGRMPSMAILSESASLRSKTSSRMSVWKRYPFHGSRASSSFVNVSHSTAGDRLTERVRCDWYSSRTCCG